MSTSRLGSRGSWILAPPKLKQTQTNSSSKLLGQSHSQTSRTLTLEIAVVRPSLLQFGIVASTVLRTVRGEQTGHMVGQHLALVCRVHQLLDRRSGVLLLLWVNCAGLWLLSLQFYFERGRSLH